MTTAFLTIACFWLAWSNGANDNFKGVATLYGSGTASYRAALAWATAATLTGSLVSVALAGRLVAVFSGKGLLADDVVDGSALLAVGAGAAVTILLATWLGMPTSTTHALTGALVGVALAAAPGGIDWGRLSSAFAQPLLLSPLLAIAVTAAVYPVLSRFRKAAGIRRETCLCAGLASEPLLAADSPVAASVGSRLHWLVRVGSTAQCQEEYRGTVAGLSAQTMVNGIHYLSGGAVCFARAVNDTPKIAALMLAGGFASTTSTLLLVTTAMAAGGWLQARRVARTMSRRITSLNAGQGLTANLVTAGLVLGASSVGLPVSTTHVSCGAIFGIGLSKHRARWRTISQIVTTWVITLPAGLLLGALAYRIALRISG